MIGVLSYAFHHRAEQAVLVLVVLALCAAQIPRLSAGLFTAAAALGGAAALFRAERARSGVFDHPWTDWAGFVAIYTSGAAQAVWWTAGILAMGLSLSTSGPRAPGRAIPLLAAALSCAVVGGWAPHLAWTALVWTVLAASALRGRSWRSWALTTTCGAICTGFGALVSLGWGLTLVSPTHGAYLDAIGAAALVGLVAAALAGTGAVAMGWTSGLRAPIALLGAGTVLVGLALVRGTAHGPAPDLAAFASDLPVHVPRRAARIPGGCVIDEEGARHVIGSLVPFERVGPCPDGGFPADQVPLLAFGENTPTARLAGWHGDDPGDVALLTRLDRSRWLVPWRVNAEIVPVWPAPRALALPAAVLLHRDGDALLAATFAGDRRISAAGHAVERPVPRQDVLVHASAAPTVRALLDTCSAVRIRAPDARCVLVLGEIERWRGLLPGPAVAGVIDADWETIEEEEVNF